MAGARPGGGQVYGDGSWQLTIFVTDLQVERSLRVRGDTHIGGGMIKLVDSLGKSGTFPHSQPRVKINEISELDVYIWS